MKKFKLFDTITKEEAIKFLKDFEEGDICAVFHLEYTQRTKENSFPILTFLHALSKMNELIYSMEEEEIEWDEEFFELYKININFLKEKCKIISEKEGLK